MTYSVQIDTSYVQNIPITASQGNDSLGVKYLSHTSGTQIILLYGIGRLSNQLISSNYTEPYSQI